MPEDYDPPASHLIGAHEVADELGYKHHGILRAMRDGQLWSIKLGPNYYTTWRAVLRWTRVKGFRGRRKIQIPK